MKQSRSHQTVWRLKNQLNKPPLSTSMKADVVVIGGGITGLTTAYLLKQAGMKVVVLEALGIGCGATGHSSAHLTSFWDEGYDQLMGRHGKAVARDVFDRMTDSINFIERLSGAGGISCDFERVPGYYYSGAFDKDRLDQTRAALTTLDIPFESVNSIPLPFKTRGALKVADQARFHPQKYLQGLTTLVEGNGSHVFENTRVLEFSDGSPCQVITPLGKVETEHVILATHTPLGINPLHAEVAPYRSYLILCELQNEPSDDMDGLFWDTQTPYHYMRLVHHKGNRLILVGGCDHKTANEDENESFIQLKRYVDTHYGTNRIVRKWSAQFYPSVDQLPFIGRSLLGSHTYVATGFSGDGLTFGTAAARIITQQICGVGNVPEQDKLEYYAPSRLKPVCTSRFWKENLDVGRHLIQDRIFRSDKHSFEKLKPGEGCVATQGISSVAAYCLPNGSLLKFSAVCTHMGGIVRWNQEEKSFDCPCHGARFNIEGEVIDGPALNGLKKV